MTLPDLTPEDPETARRLERVLEGVLMGLIVLLAGGLGAPELVDVLRDGSVDLGAVFYPVLMVAVVALAWGRRTRQ